MMGSTPSSTTLDDLTELAAAVLNAAALQEVADAVLGRIVTSDFASRAFLRFQRGDATTFDEVLSSQLEDPELEAVRGVASLTAARVQSDGAPVFAPDALADAAYADQAAIYDHAPGGVICIPMQDAQGAFGALYAERTTERAPFTQADLDVMRHLTVLAGHTCRNLDRHEATLRRQEHLESLLGIFRSFSGVMELSTLLDHLTQMTLSITKAERAFVLLVEGNELTYGAGRDRECVLPAANFRRISHSVCQKVVETRQEVCVFDAGADAEVASRQSVVNLQLQGIVAVPLVGRDGLGGILYIDSRMRNLEGLRKEMKLLRALGSVASIMIENARMYQRVTVDARTGLFTRALLAVRLEEELARARRYGRPCAVLMVGIDGYDEIVRTHGQDRAEIALRLVAQIVRTQARGGIDFPARFTDERLALVLPETGRDGALVLAERIREKVARAAFAGNSGTALSLTISVGASLWQPPDGSSAKLLDEATEALEASFYNDGNQTTFYDELEDV